MGSGSEHLCRVLAVAGVVRLNAVMEIQASIAVPKVEETIFEKEAIVAAKKHQCGNYKMRKEGWEKRKVESEAK